MMHRVPVSFTFLFILFCANPVVLADANKDQLNATTQLNLTFNESHFAALGGIKTRASQKPILEILYAWTGFDQWECYGGVYHADNNHRTIFDTNQHPITDTTNALYQDVSAKVQAALGGAGQPGILYLPLDVLNLSADGKTVVQGGAGRALSVIGQNGNMTLTGFRSWWCISTRPIDAWKSSFNNDYYRKTDRYWAQEPRNQKCSLAPSAANLNPGDAVMGIVYRDIDGIHFRRFEGWQNIALPMVSSFTSVPRIALPGIGLSGDGLTGAAGACFYGHQFEEIGRGLITLSVSGSNSMNFLAFDRFGWANTIGTPAKEFAHGIYGPHQIVGGDIYLLYKRDGKSSCWNDRRSIEHFRCATSKSGTTICRQPAGYAIFPQNGGLGLEGQWRDVMSAYQYYDETGQFQRVNHCSGNVDPASASVTFPGQGDIWFAFDRTPTGMVYTMGTGRPTNEDDFNNPAVNSKVLYTLTDAKVSPYLRNFAFNSDDATMQVTNIESRYLNPAKKFQTPPFLKNKFLFWRPEWQASTPDSISLTFKARGNNISVAFGTKNYNQRIPSGSSTSFDTSYQYAVKVDLALATVAMEKGDGTSLNPSTPVGLATPGNEVYADYWISYAGGRLAFGSGTVVGERVIAKAVDPRPTPGIQSFCFSSLNRTTDYINITAAPFQAIFQNDLTDTPGTYNHWSELPKFAVSGSGAFSISYANNVPNDTQATVMIGLNAGTPATAVPTYEVIFGTNSNTAHEIRKNSTTVNTTTMPAADDGTTPSLLISDSNWHDLWIAYDSGTIIYGSGNIVGQNVLATWSDPATTNGINSFCLATTSSSVKMRFNGLQNFASQHAYTAKAGSLANWQPLWQFSTANQCALTFNAVGNPTTTSAPAPGAGAQTPAAGSTIQIGFSSSDRPVTSPVYRIVINDTDGTAYIAKEGVKQPSSVTFLTAAQMPQLAAAADAPTATNFSGIPYWIAFQDGTFLVGTGSNPVDLSSLILKWSDSTFNKETTPAITRFSLAAAGNKVIYNNITVPSFTPFATAFNTIKTALQTQSLVQTAWAADQTQINLKLATSKLLYWGPTLQFNQPGSTSFSCNVQKQDANALTVYFGLADILPGQDSNAAQKPAATSLRDARYVVAISDTGIVEISDNTGTVLNTSPTINGFTKLTDNGKHLLWVNVSTGTATPGQPTFTVGIDSLSGTNPLYTYTLDAAKKPTAPFTLNYVGIGCGASAAAITNIKTDVFSDPTNYTTNGTGQFNWQKNWTFAQPDQEQISFSITAPLNAQNAKQNLVFAIGLAPSATTTPGSTAPYNNAAYVIVVDYTQQVAILKTPDMTTRLNSVHYPDHNPDGSSPIAAGTTPCLVNLNDGQPHACTLSYDHGRLRFSIAPTSSTAPQVVWSYVDSSPIPSISQFSFTTLQSTASISAIGTLGGQSLNTIDQVFANLLTTLSTTPSNAITQLNAAIAQRLHVADASSANFFIANVVNVLTANAELFNDADRAKIVSSLQPTIYETSTFSSTQIASINACINSMTVPLNWATIITSYYTNTAATQGSTTQQNPLAAIFNPTGATTPALPTPLAATDPRRALFMYKIANLTTLSAAIQSQPSVLTNIQALSNAFIPYAAALTPAEQKTITALTGLASTSAILSNTQDPASILALLPTLVDRNQQIAGLQGLLSAQYNALANPSITNPLPALTTTPNGGQCQAVIDLLYSIANSRDELTSDGSKNLASALKFAQALSSLSNRATSSGTEANGLPTTPVKLSDILTLSTAPINFSVVVKKLTDKIGTITLAPSTDLGRQAYFNLLSLIPTSTASMLPADLNGLVTSIITPLQNTPLTSSESGVLTQLSAFITSNVGNINKILANTQDPASILALIPTLTDMAQQTTALQGLLNAVRNGTAANPAPILTPAQYQAIMNQLCVIVGNRDELTLDGLKNLLLTLQIAKATATLNTLSAVDTNNISGQGTATKLTLDNLINLLSTPVPFANQVTKIVSRVNGIIILPSTDPIRQAFFQYLALVSNTAAAMGQDDLAKLSTKVLVPLQSTPLASDESAIVKQVIDLAGNTSAINTKILNNIQDPVALIALLQTLVSTPLQGTSDAQIAAIQALLTAQRNATPTAPVTPLTAAQYQSIINFLYLIALNRDELSSTGQQNLLLTLQLAAANSSLNKLKTQGTTTPFSISDITTLANTAISFTNQLAKLTKAVSGILVLPSTDTARQAYFQYLSSLTSSNVTMLPADLTSLVNNVVVPLQKTPLSSTEAAILGQLVSTSSNTSALNNKVLTNVQDPTSMLTLLKTLAVTPLQNTRDAQINALQSLLTAQRNATVSAPAAPISASQYQDIINLLFVIANNRDELSADGLQSLLLTLQLATATTSLSGLKTTPSGTTSDPLVALLPKTAFPLIATTSSSTTPTDITSLANAPISFAYQVTKLTNAVKKIILLPSSDPVRQAYFQYLAGLTNSTISMTPADLTTLATMVIVPLQKTPLGADEAAIINQLIAMSSNTSAVNNKVLSNVQDPTSMIALLKTLAPLTLQNTRDAQINAIQALLTAQRNATATAPAAPISATQYQDLINLLYLIAYNRDELSTAGVQALLLTLQLSTANTNLSDLRTSSNQGTDPILSGMPTIPVAISDITTLATTPVVFTYQVTKLAKAVNAIILLPSSDPVRQAYFKYLAGIVNSTISMTPNDLTNLVNLVIVPFQKTPLSPDETTIMNQLIAMSSNTSAVNNKVLSNVQDPTSMIALLKTLAPLTLQNTRDAQINAIQALLTAQRNATATAPAAPISATQYQDLINILYIIAYNRDELSTAGVQALLLTLQLSTANTSLSNLKTSANQGNNTDPILSPMPTVPATISDIAALASSSLVFTYQVAKLAKAVNAIILLPSGDPLRQTYFKYLAGIVSSPVSMTPDDLTNLVSLVIVPFQKTPLSTDEAAIINQLIAMSTNTSAINNKVLSNVQDPTSMIALLKTLAPVTLQNTRDAQISAIQGLLNAQHNATAANPTTPVTAAQYQDIFNILYLIALNRDELSTAGVRNLLLTLQVVNALPPLAGLQTRSTATKPSTPPSADDLITALLPSTPAKLSTITALANTPVDFTDQVAKLTKAVSAIVVLPSTDATRQAYFQYLAGFTTSSVTMEPADLTILVNNVLAPLQKTPLSDSETDIITQVVAMCNNTSAVNNKILANTQDPAAIIALLNTLSPTSLQTNRDTHVNALQALLTAQRNATASAGSANPVQPLSPAQYQAIINLLYLIAINRDELSINGQKNLLVTLQLANTNPALANLKTLSTSTTATPSNPPSPEDIIATLLPLKPATIGDILTIAGTAIDFANQVAKVSKAVNTIITLPSTDPIRQAYFQYLTTLAASTLPTQSADLKALTNNVVTPLTATPLTTAESNTLAQLTSMIGSAATASALFTTQLLSGQNTIANLTDYIAMLANMLKNKGVSTIFNPGDFDTYVAQLEYVVDSRELLQAQPDASGTINPSAQKAAKATIQTLTNLLQLAQLAPELASHQSDLATLLTQATSDYQFADRIAYGKVEIANLMKRRQNNPNPTVDYFYNRLVSKLQILSNAPGIKTTDNFNDLEASILNPLISLTTDPTQAALLQSLHDTIEASKQSILEQQKTFIYHFNAAVAQQTNTSLYISMLQTIITNERKGLITFDETSSSTTSSGAVQSHVPDSTTFFNALTTAVAQRDILSATDCSNLATAINYALYSDVYTARADLQPKLQMLYTQASTPIAFADRVTTYATKVSSILKLLPTDQDRVNYFTVLSTLSSAPGNLTTDSLNKLVNTIMTPLSASPLASNEQSIITALQQFVAGAQTQVKSAAYQMSLLPLVADWGVVISTLQTMLNNKGISVIFASEDIQLFINALTMLVNNRELLQVNTSTQSSVTTAAGQSVLIQNLITLLRTTELAAEFTASKTTLDQLIAAAGTDHLFADRIAYMQTEIATMTPIQQKNSNDPMLQIMFDRMIAKLTIILNASGPMTSSLFDTLDVGVITPLLALVDTDARRQQIQAVRSTIQSSKATVLQQQATFTYQYNLAQTQAANPSMYVNMLQGIINGQRQGTITFSGSDAQTFITALTTAVKTRDNLSDSDTTALINAINYALFSDVYTSNQAFQNTLQQLLTTASTPIPFADRVATYSAKAKSIIAIKDSTDATRVAYFNCLQALPGAPGVQTTDSLTLLQNSVITPFTSSPMSQNEQTIIKALQSFVTTAQTTIKTATYQLAALLSEPDISKYLAGLQDLLTRKGTYFTFVPTDYTNFASQVAYIVNSRELLDTRGLNAAQKLVTSTQASADFSTLSTTLKPLATQITQPFYFNDRVTWMITEIQQIVSRSPAATDPMLIRFITKLGLLLNAPQINTTDQQFSDLQAKVLTPLGALNLSPDQQTQVQTLSNQILALKSQVLLTATTFQYQFGLAQAQLANTDAYLDILTSIMTKHHSGELTFSGNDNVTMLKAVQDLVNNRDILSKAQITIVQALITYCGASSLYQDQASQTTCLNLMQQLAQPIPLAQLVAKYSSQVKSIIFLSSDDPARTLFFTQLGNMAQSTDSVPPTLITQINNTLITPLNSANPSFNEQTVIKNLQSFVAGATQKAQSVSNLLQMADDSNPALIDYANAVAGIMQQKGSPLTFSDSDTTNALGALAYVSASRELLSADQIKTVLQLINRIQWLGTFKDNDAQLQSILADLNTIHLFQDRVNYASQELKALMASNANPAGNRMARLVLKLSTVLSATGPAVASDFNTLQNTLTQLQTLALPTAQMQTVTNLIAQVAASQSSILAAQQTFAYNYAQAQLIQNNLPNYILALKNIISLKRQNQMNFDPADYATFVNALSAVSANQDAMTTADISNLKDAINYTYYSAGFTTYQQALTDLYNTLNTPPTFAQRVGQYAAQISAILQLDGADPKRIQFFANIQFMPNLQGSGNIADVQNFITSMLTPLQTTPLNQSEQAVVATLAQFVASVQQKATALSYNLTQLATQVSAAQNDTTQDPMSVMVSGLNTILTQINAGTIKLAGNDYQSLLTVVSGLVDNRELFTAAEVTQVQSILQSMQFNAGFAAFKDTLGTLYTNAATPLTFADRVAKYVTNFPQINNTPTGDPSKGQFITMVSSIFNAPGTITNDLLTTLQNQVVNPIKYGNFSDDQKGKMSQVIMQLTAQQNTLNSFKYRFTQAQNEVTPQAYYADLTQMINDLTAGTLTFAANDFSTFLSELTNQVALRPMTPDTQSSVYSLVQLVKTAPTFATRADLVSTITQLMSLLNTPVDPLVRINYFEQNIMVMLGQPITSGQRQQFFVRLGQFSSELTSLTADILAQPTVQQALQQLATTLNQDAQSSNAQSNEQILMTSVARQLQDISGTTAATLVPTVATTTGLTSGGVLLPTTIPQTTPTTSRAYTRAPVSRFAR